jgi:hypothetical protein
MHCESTSENTHNGVSNGGERERERGRERSGYFRGNKIQINDARRAASLAKLVTAAKITD